MSLSAATPPLLIIGHGTRSTQGVAEFGELVDRVREQAGRSVLPPPAIGGGDSDSPAT